MKMTIYGASDDLVEVESESFREEFDAYPDWKGRIIAPDGESLNLTLEFGARGKHVNDWTITVGNSETYPSWPMYFSERPDREGDPALVLEVPEGTVVVEDEE